MLGVDPAVQKNFTSCSTKVGRGFARTLDAYRPTQHYVAALLERGVKALIYVGKNDWICNHVGNERWTLDLEWTKHDEFSSRPLREWIVDGKAAGMTRSAGGLTFATIEGAGHMVRFFLLTFMGDSLTLPQVPYDKPKESLELVNRWLSGKDL